MLDIGQMMVNQFVLDQGAALAFYILSALFFNSFVIIFVVTVLLAALDFWVVKNVSGRILVGLRWWNEINDLGESVWKFESLDQEVSLSSLIPNIMGSVCLQGVVFPFPFLNTHFSLQSLARMNKKDSWLFWWTLYLAVSISYLTLQCSIC